MVIYSLRTSFSYVVKLGSDMSGRANGRLLVLISTLDGDVALVVLVVKPRTVCVCFVGSGGMAVASKAADGVGWQRNDLCPGGYRL